MMLSTQATAEPSFTRLVDNFEGKDLSGWQSSMSPEYYKEAADRQALAIVNDPERGNVLCCKIRFADEKRSEPVFITRKLEPNPRKTDIVSVRFWAKLTAPAIAAEGGFIVRLRTGDRSFTDYDVQKQLGTPFPVGKWVRVELDTAIGPNVRNVWSDIFDSIREMTFRLDDIDDRNVASALLLDDIELVTLQPAVETAYQPKVSPRPDDGKTQVLFLKHRAAGYYNMEAALRDVAPEAGIDTFFYRGYHFEFFGFPDSPEAVLQYDAIIMLDVDPIMMSFEQCAWIADAVASGAHFLCFGGPSTFTHAKDFKPPLLAILPVSFSIGDKDIGISDRPVAPEQHLLNQGFDPAGIGKVTAVQALQPKPGAEVPWTAKGQPLVVTMPVGRGRATVVNTWPHVATSADGDFFTSPLSDDLMRQLLRYALGRTEGALISRLALPNLSLTGGGRIDIRVASPGAEADDMRLIHDGRLQTGPRKTAEGMWEFSVNMVPDNRSESRRELRIERLSNGNVSDYRDFHVEVRHPLRLEIAWTRNKYTFAPGSPVEFEAVLGQPEKPENGAETEAGLTLKAVLRDPRSDYRWVVPTIEETPGRSRFAGRLPLLSSGEYLLEVSAYRANRQLVTAASACYVVDPLELTDFFPIMSIVGIAGQRDNTEVQRLDERGIEERVEDLLAHGFNTAAITGTSRFQSNRPANFCRLKGWAESYAQRRGMATTYEYSNFKLLEKEGKTVPCVFSPEYPEALHKHLSWQIDVGSRTPRLICAKIVDEPASNLNNMDRCQHCRTQFRERYGIEMSEAKEEEITDPYTRWAMADFIGEYVSHAFASSASIVKEEKATFDLLLTFDGRGLAMPFVLSLLHCQQDVFAWSRHVEWADFDIYPYFYPQSQRLRMVLAGFGMARMRDVARARRIPWGFYVELDDRNWPFQKNPKEATAECAFTAIAHGAGYLNSFVNQVVGTGTGARPERWETAGRALRSIRRLGPVLNRMPSVPAPVAILYPNTQEAVGDGYLAPDYALAALRGGFGDVDIYSEEVVIEKGAIPYRGLILLKAEYVHERLVPMLKSWMLDGGVLVCDRLPARTERGAAINWGLDEKETVPFPGRNPLIRFSVSRVGKGRIIRIENDIDKEFEERVEARQLDPAAVRAYRLALAAVLDTALTPNVRVAYDETETSVDLIEAGLRGNEDAVLLSVVNHQPNAQRVAVTLNRPDVRWLVDAVSMTPIEFERTNNGALSLPLDVEGRWARLIAGYRKKPQRLELGVANEKVRPGEELRYHVRVLDEFGKLVPGGILLEIEVHGPDGVLVPRLGGPRAPLSGEQTISVPIPINACIGQYRVDVRAPQADLSAVAGFLVSPPSAK
ncbi:MAG: hypothetical protein AB1696_26245 [Planctomycetota bacterium]